MPEGYVLSVFMYTDISQSAEKQGSPHTSGGSAVKSWGASECVFSSQ